MDRLYRLWILCIELCHCIWGINQVFSPLPRVILRSIAFPANEILKFLPTAKPTTVQNLFYFPFWFIVYDFWFWWGVWSSAWNGVFLITV